MSRRLSTDFGSFESLKSRMRCGWSLRARQMRRTELRKRDCNVNQFAQKILHLDRNRAQAAPKLTENHAAVLEVGKVARKQAGETPARRFRPTQWAFAWRRPEPLIRAGTAVARARSQAAFMPPATKRALSRRAEAPWADAADSSIGGKAFPPQPNSSRPRVVLAWENR